MPELPEVEVLTQSIKKVALESTVFDIKYHRANLRYTLPKRLLNKVLKNNKIVSISRRSKFILLETKVGFTTIHLGMTGNLIYSDKKTAPAKHTHVTFSLKIKNKVFYLHYVDPRRFGYIKAFETTEIDSIPDFSHLGPEPLLERRLGEHLYIRSRNKASPIKTFLMDASHVVGVGNIYSCESLFDSGIDPRRSAASLSIEEFRLISRSIKKILKKSIKAGGSSIKDFKSLDGSSGYFSLQLFAYGRAGKPCKKCKNEIIQIKQSGRGTWFCEKCQK